MAGRRNRRALGLVGASALILVLSASWLPTGAMADLPPSAGVTIDAGQLKLHMSSDFNSFAYFDSGGTEVDSQEISQTQKCRYTSGTNLVAATADGGTVGFARSNSQIGVDSKDGATKCTQVNTSPESLTLELNNGAGSTMAGLYATYAMLDVELKFSPLVTITAYKDGNPTGVSEDYDCSTSDCGPDRDAAGDNSNIRFPIDGTVLFDKVVITAAPTGGSTTSAGISLEGGNDLYQDGTQRDSIFYMAQPAEGEICGGQTVTEPTGSGQASVTHLGALGTDCKAYVLTYTRDPQTNDRELSFITSDGPTVSFDVKIFAWDPEPVANPVPPTFVDPPLPSHPGQWCNGTSTSPTMPSGENWCLVTQTTTTYGPDAETPNDPGWVPGYGGQLMQVTEEWLLIGDAGCRR